ncbi:ABC transporter substrate-binding protein [Blastococcus saxobsidens]|uniref:Iron complex transport system substrate-binding protein n=1 Tax=Blastococcus saxobsidens TaxID=138336 RepID=A0A4Q7Y0Y7_9ACTN|nr:ABC transporter substrate-binding protein [Blastococcus saxobsidens]RZU30422.1 iron complex transport system substrate-binding protein [Blastococcus saxobsidens]
MSHPVRTRLRRRLVPVAALLALAPAIAACGGSDEAPSSSGTTSSAGGDFPVTVTGDDGELTLDEQPEQIVVLSATATEMLFAIGADEQVEAVDSTSNHPAEAPVTDLSSFTPNAEAIAGYGPDLVVLSDDQNGIVDALDRLEVPTLLLGAAESLEDSYAQLETLGQATGHAEEAAEVVAGMRERIAEAVDAAGEGTEGLRVYHELDPTYYSATSGTFIGEVYQLFGLENIADGSPEAAGGYPQLSAEYVVGQQPDLIVLADTVCCDQSAETVAQRPAFDTVPAVTEGRVLEANDDIASRWGPRIVEFVEAVATTLAD